MTISDIETLFHKAKNISKHFNANPEFCWHGGEPMLNGVELFEEIFALQERVFADQPVVNIVQTNLTVLDERRLALLKRFSYVSISLDVAGRQRVSKTGREIEDVVLRNMARLANEKFTFGAISVLTRANINDVDLVFRFYNGANVHYRILPFYRADNQEQADAFSLTLEEIAAAYERAIDLWFTEGNGIAIAPLDAFRKIAINYAYDKPNTYRFNKGEYEPVLIVDTDGSVFDVAETYDEEHRYGNIFTDADVQLLSSSGRMLSIAEAHGRMETYCTQCEYQNFCSGWWAAAATIFERTESDAHGCVVAKRAIDRSVQWIREYKNAEALTAS